MKLNLAKILRDLQAGKINVLEIEEKLKKATALTYGKQVFALDHDCCEETRPAKKPVEGLLEKAIHGSADLFPPCTVDRVLSLAHDLRITTSSNDEASRIAAFLFQLDERREPAGITDEGTVTGQPKAAYVIFEDDKYVTAVLGDEPYAKDRAKELSMEAYSKSGSTKFMTYEKYMASHSWRVAVVE